MAKINHISVLMPVYNGARYVVQAIKSILNQTFRDFELVIIDDGSTDDTSDLISGIKDSRINYNRTEHRGLSAALNTGIDLCSSDWIARMDSDDISVPMRLERQVRFIENNPDYDIISCWSVYFRDPAKPIFLLKSPVAHGNIVSTLNLHNPINHSGVIYRKNLIRENRYREDFTGNEDFELFFRLRDKVKFSIIPEFLIYVRLRKDSKAYLTRDEKLYKILFSNAFHNLVNATSRKQAFYWTHIISWLEYFHGDKTKARKYFLKFPSVRNMIAYITTFLPQKTFDKFIAMRIRYRISFLFEKKKYFIEELNSILKSVSS
ncbi:MAG: glycosyltransferase [Ignavibacteria bacterium]|nr:glycosyltransferase [Ignavibacteria bacterium]